MDTVLGLSVTPAAFGWVLAEGHGADGTILDHQELALQAGRGVQAVSTAEQVAGEVLRIDAAATQNDRRLRVIGVTWNDEAAAQAALLMEALTDAGFDNVVPVRLLEAVETLARAIAPVIGYDQTAVCILEHEWATVVMVDTHEGETQTATKQVPGGFDGLKSWLTGMFSRKGWRPSGVVVVGAGDDLNALSWQLEKSVPVPVFAQAMAQVTVARGAALAAARSTDFTDEQLVARPAVQPVSEPAAPRRLSYAGAVTALAAGAVTFVSSLSLAVGIQLAPHNQAASKHASHATPPPVAEARTPALAPAPARPAPEAAPADRSKAPAEVPAAESAAPEERPSPPFAQQPDPVDRQPYLTRVLEHIPGDAGGGDPSDDSAPHPQP
ncbi:DUF7159 family protein [Mycobacterium parmense]|uniref:DUF7159 domain-containing protein n=1 Tax=Mycobacterium parmense TaxID=185642 RepID=A0A7I7YTH6_9MYCO|nr:hypothetical protein [Mycobacterium parmense]MCV7353398.1 hypothetical protein [Mycobacterium parmense]ORW51573.1 hypothetical protein AWC20_22730 [Mycobacterium parmense]BBZ44041.1 hypothetical protein MPRM_13220 [Mycobacterium parmense]